MFPSVMNKKNKQFVTNVIEFLTKKYPYKINNKTLWINVGSYVINGQRKDSDLDLIAVLDRYESKYPDRSKLYYQGIPISLTFTSKDNFISDGKNGYLGGYLTGKLLNPHMIFGNICEYNDLLASAGNYIGDFSSFLHSFSKNNHLNLSPKQIVVFNFIAYLNIDPDFDSYLLSYYLNPKFRRLLRLLSVTHTKMLTLSGHIKKNKNNKYIFKNDGFESLSDFHRERMRTCARRNGFGVHCHESYEFVNWYLTNSEHKKLYLDPKGKDSQEMFRFLKKSASFKNEIFV